MDYMDYVGVCGQIFFCCNYAALKIEKRVVDHERKVWAI